MTNVGASRSAIPFTIDGSGVPRISVAHEDLDPANGNSGAILSQAFTTTTPNSIIISYEDVEFFPSGGYVNAQAELFDDGRVNICQGPMNTDANSVRNSVAAGLEDESVSLTFPAPLPGFSPVGVWSGGVNDDASKCACYYSPCASLIVSQEEAYGPITISTDITGTNCEWSGGELDSICGGGSSCYVSPSCCLYYMCCLPPVSSGFTITL
jgi:hypothetical protein